MTGPVEPPAARAARAQPCLSCGIDTPGWLSGYGLLLAGLAAEGVLAFLVFEQPLAWRAQALFFALLFPALLWPIIAMVRAILRGSRARTRAERKSCQP